MGRPPIGITLAYEQRRAGVFSLRQDYVRSVEQAGGLPLVLAPSAPAQVGEVLDHVQALVFTGGSDIDPALYGEAPHANLGTVIRERDEYELALCKEALRRDLPILAICRGHQVLNVATGGTLYQDLPSELSRAGNHDPERERVERTHDVDIVAGSRLGQILGTERVAVNSFHHQAVKTLGQGLRVSARSPEDGVIEGIEDPDRRFVIGVQWHPESFWAQPDNFHSLFAAVVQAGSGA